MIHVGPIVLYILSTDSSLLVMMLRIFPLLSWDFT